MKHISNALLIVVIALTVSVLTAQQLDAKIAGRILDKDGVTPVQGAMVSVTYWVTVSGVTHVREKFTTRTGRDGTYASSGLSTGRITVTLTINGQAVTTKGEIPGDEIYLTSGSETVIDFDLSKAPPPRK